MNRLQTSFRLTTEPDPRYCARAFCNVLRRKTATHTVTVGGREFNVCSECARNWESQRSARVTKIQEVANG